MKATSPIPIVAPDMIYSEYDLDRTVTAVRLDRRGDIVLELASGEGQVGAATLGYIASRSRNVRLDLVYTVTQNTPITLRRRRSVVIGKCVQGRLSSPEVDAFGYRTSRSGLKYRLYSPPQGRGSRHRQKRGQRPLILWLHGAGEGGSLADDYYDNETTLRANRGALGFASEEGQRIFTGAYVVDGPRFAPLLREIVSDLARRYSIDRDRMYVAGCSNGGYLSLKMTTAYPDLFAASVAGLRCRHVTEARGADADHGRRAAHDHDPDVARRLTGRHDGGSDRQHRARQGADPQVVDDAVRRRDLERLQGSGHGSWIYVARNDARIKGIHLWQWMARQRR